MFLLAGASSFCNDAKPIMSLIGTVITIFKIAIPVLLIVLGSIDLGKAVVASDEKQIKEATSSLVKRIIIGIVIFFVPTIVKAIFNLFTYGSDAWKDASVCIECVTKGCSAE